MTTQIKGNATSTFGGNVDVTGNVITDAPAFKAYMNADVSISGSVFTKVPFNTKEFDLTSDYDNTTNYRFTPSVAGYYSVTFNIHTTSVTRVVGNLYKNGVGYQKGFDIEGTAFRASTGTVLVYCNGTTDYLEVYVYRSTTGNLSGNTTSSPDRTSFQAFLARAV